MGIEEGICRDVAATVHGIAVCGAESVLPQIVATVTHRSPVVGADAIAAVIGHDVALHIGDKPYPGAVVGIDSVARLGAAVGRSVVVDGVVSHHVGAGYPGLVDAHRIAVRFIIAVLASVPPVAHDEVVGDDVGGAVVLVERDAIGGLRVVDVVALCCDVV